MRLLTVIKTEENVYYTFTNGLGMSIDGRGKDNLLKLLDRLERIDLPLEVQYTNESEKKDIA